MKINNRRHRLILWMVIVNLVSAASIWQTQPLAVSVARKTTEVDRAAGKLPERSTVTNNQLSGGSPTDTTSDLFAIDLNFGTEAGSGRNKLAYGGRQPTAHLMG